MAGSTFGKNFSITSWVETGGNGIGVVIDGVPAGLALGENDIQAYMNRRRPTAACLFTRRHENDFVTVNSGLEDGVTNGTPMAMTIINSAIKYKSARRVTDRDNASRTAAGAVATAILGKLGITFCSYVRSIGPVSIKYGNCSLDDLKNSPVNMPDAEASEKAVEYLKEIAAEKKTAGGVIEIIITGVPAGIGQPFFDKLDARLAAAVMSIDRAKGVEFGDGFSATDSERSGGITAGLSDSSEIVLRVSFAPTPLASSVLSAVDCEGNDKEIEVADGAEITTVPRTVVVAESMAAAALLDLLFENMHSKLDDIAGFYGK
ncbi:MAG: chorismate synthase [Lachnospiraceae bacterium]|nr:chorismate synthase [Lachnospiraceae bacterium]